MSKIRRRERFCRALRRRVPSRPTVSGGGGRRRPGGKSLPAGVATGSPFPRPIRQPPQLALQPKRKRSIPLARVAAEKRKR